jgi:hypothetical protein
LKYQSVSARKAAPSKPRPNVRPNRNLRILMQIAAALSGLFVLF